VNFLKPAGGRPRARGAILILVMAVMLALSLLGLAFLNTGDANGMDLVREVQHSQSFHVAEAGLQQVVARLRVQSAYRQSPTNLCGALAGVSYAVRVARTGDLYYLVSCSAVRACTRSIRQVVEVRANGWPDAFSYALFGSNGDIDLKKGVTISGDVFDYGNISMAKDATVSNGMVYATGVVTGSGDFQVGGVPAEPPAPPTLDTTGYDNLLAQAASSTNTSVAFPVTLQGGTVYVKGSVSLGQVTGPGTLVVSGDIDMGQAAYVSPGCTIISGGSLSFAKAGLVGSNGLFYARTEIRFAKDGTLLQGCTLLTPGTIDALKNFEMSGVMLALGPVLIKKDAVVLGSIVGSGITADKNLTVRYDPSLFTTNPPPGITPVVDVYRVSWREEGLITP
jgi:Tfp pilus assembly protein PilX